MSNFIKITTDFLDVAAITELVTDPSTGAISLFIGTTRDEFNGKKVVRLDYEAYVPMAKKKIASLCDNIRDKWQGKVHNIAIHHRLGRVDPTEASVIIAITSAHRKESLDSVQYAIDSLKATVPIWKKEVYELGNEEEWKENKECLWSKVAKVDISSLKTESQEENKKDSNLYLSSSDKPANDIDPKYVQITASNDEIERRIEAFIVRKRDEINTNNVLEFCSRHLVKDEPNEFSCARTDSTGLIRKKDSASHLRKSSVDNSKFVSNGKPQEMSNVQPATLPFGIEERVVNLEEHLKLKPIQRELYLRLKDIEDRVLYLEGISPEYFEGITKYPQTKECARDEKKGDPSNDSNESEMGRLPSEYDVDSMESKEIQLKNTEYKEALSNSLCVINKRIQELQTRLRN